MRIIGLIIRPAVALAGLGAIFLGSFYFVLLVEVWPWEPVHPGKEADRYFPVVVKYVKDGHFAVEYLGSDSFSSKLKAGEISLDVVPQSADENRPKLRYTAKRLNESETEVEVTAASQAIISGKYRYSNGRVFPLAKKDMNGGMVVGAVALSLLTTWGVLTILRRKLPENI